jgi:hypothetical protein
MTGQKTDDADRQDRQPEAVDGALGALRKPVVGACAGREEWPAKVVASIYAVLDLVATEPAGRSAVTSLSPGQGEDAGHAYREAVDHFAALMEGIVPPEERWRGSSRGSVVGIAAILADRVRAGKVNGLREIGPDLVQYALLPYLGLTEAKRWAELSSAELDGR